MAYQLGEDRQHQEWEVRAAAENLVVVLDRHFSEAVGKIDWSLRELGDHLQSELRTGGRLGEREMAALLEKRGAPGWAGSPISA